MFVVLIYFPEGLRPDEVFCTVHEIGNGLHIEARYCWSPLHYPNGNILNNGSMFRRIM